MTEEDIVKLAMKLSGSLATKDDVDSIKEDIASVKQDVSELKQDVTGLKQEVTRLDGKITELDSKVDTVLEFASHVDETTDDHEKRITDIEAVPLVAHELKLHN